MIKKVSLVDVLAKSSLFIYLTLSFLAIFLFTNKLMYPYQLWIGYIYILMTARIVNNMQIAHTSNEDFPQLQLQPIFFCVLLNIFTIYAMVAKPDFVSYKMFAYFTAAGAALCNI